MNKAKLLFIFIIIIIISASIYASKTSEHKNVYSNNFRYSFSVISDTHIGVNDRKKNGEIAIKNLITSLKCIKNCFPKDKCIVINGDVVDNYYKSSYNTLSNLIINVNSNVNRLPYIYFNLGNHELKPDGTGPSITKYYTRSINEFITKTSEIQKQLDAAPDISHYHRIKNKSYDLQYVCKTPFFFLGSDTIENGATNECAYLKPEPQLNYLDNSIGSSLSFVFCHQPPYNTVKGSNYMNCITNTFNLLNVLTKHPKAIIFNGHTHRSFETSPLTFGNNYSKLGPCTVLTSPSVYRSLEGLHVTVYDNRVYIEGVKYISNTKYITKPEWSINVIF